MAALPENLDGGLAIVIEDVPPGTGIVDLVSAFSPFGAIQLAFVGPPCVVAFATQAAAARALLVSSMKSVSLADFRKKASVSGASCPSPAPTGPPMPPEPEAEAEASPAETAVKSTLVHGATPPAVKMSCTVCLRRTDAYDHMLRIRLANLLQSCGKYDYHAAWTNGYRLGCRTSLPAVDSNYEDAWIAGFDAGKERAEERDALVFYREWEDLGLSLDKDLYKCYE